MNGPLSLPTLFFGAFRRTAGVGPLGIVALFLCGLSASAPARAEVPDFRTDVMAVLSKAGCNMGACHGNQSGKGGFYLSLRGEDPEFDYLSLTREFSSRRINPFDAERSLMLLKPAGQVAHQGGVRFRDGSEEYRILRDWIAAHAPRSNGDAPRLESLEVTPRERIVREPDDSVQLHVIARFSDGRQRDVTGLACYESSTTAVSIDHGGLVRREAFGEATVMVRFLERQSPVSVAFIPARQEFAWNDAPAHNEIDSLVYEKLRALRLNPSEPCDDATFVRRAFLDALGILPTADEARRFVADSDPEKRVRLIDHLLARPEFADHWALKWSDILRNEERVLDPEGVQRFHTWIRDSIAEGKPIDRFVRELVVARGSTFENPPANFYRANRDPSTRGETAARLFLGVRLQCARCHNHPFDHWTQDDYYSWASLFARIDYEIGENNRSDRLDKNEFAGDQTVLVKDEGEVKNPRTGKSAPPRFLGADMPPLDKTEDRLPPLADWLTQPDNELFVSTQVNFIWYHLLGRGLVEPIDDFRATNPAVNPPLLDALRHEFASSGFDLRHLVRWIMNSRTYQVSATPNETNAEDESNFSRAIVRRLTAEQLLDAQCHVTGAAAEFGGYPQGTRAGQLAGVQRLKQRTPTAEGDRFLKALGKPERLLACECERSNETTLGQAFLFISGEGLNQRLVAPGNRLEQLARSDRGDDEIIDELFWTALSRPPTRDELNAARDALARVDDRLAAVQDLAWALMNAKEFVFRR